VTAHHPLDDERGWALVDQYAAGDIDPADMAAMTAWLANTPAAADLVAALRETRVVSDAEVAGWTLPDVYAGFPQRPAVPRAAAPRPSRWRLKALGGAIGAALSALVAVGVYVAQRQATPSTPASAARTYVSGRGQVAHVVLPNGTRIALAPMSRLTIAGTEATLDGEALFDVVHDPAHPFVVRARNATTRVLGTRFGVRAYAEDAAVRVAVGDGRVAVNAVALAQGDVVRVGAAGITDDVRHGVRVADLLGWTEGRLVFDNVPLREAAVQLSRWYGVDFVVADDAVGQLRVTTTVLQSDAVDTVMRAITISTGTSFERRGDTVTIKKSTRAARVTELAAPPQYAAERF